MAEKTSKPKKSAADKRKSADAALEARIAARKAALTTPEEKTDELPFVPSEPAVAAPSVAAPVKAKRSTKPRAAKAKPEVDANVMCTILDRVTAKAVAKVESAHAKVLSGVNKHYKGEIAKLKAEHKAALKKLISLEESREIAGRAFTKGVAHGEKQATKAITAALKGR